MSVAPCRLALAMTWILLTGTGANAEPTVESADGDGLSPEQLALVLAHEEHPTEESRAALGEATDEAIAACEGDRHATGSSDGTCETAVRLAEAFLGPDHPSLAEFLDHLAQRLQAKASYSEAEPLYRKALAIREATLGPDTPELAVSLNNLAGLLDTIGEYAEAETMYRRSLAIQETLRGPDHPEVATVLRNLGWLMQHTGDLEEAAALFRRALAIREVVGGPDDPGVALVLTDLAGVLKYQGDHAEAESLLRRALAIREAALGPSHLLVSQTSNLLALVLMRTAAYAEAESLMRRSLEIVETEVGPNHPYVASCLTNLAALLKATGDYGEAAPLLRRALAIDEATIGPTHPDLAITANNLAGLLKTLGAYAEAESLFRRALAIEEANLAPNHPGLVVTLANLAGVLRTTGAYAEAETLLRRALAIAETALGPSHRHVGVTLNNLAQLLVDTRSYAQAEPLLRRSLAIAEAGLGQAHPEFGVRLANLAGLLKRTEDHAEAAALLRRALVVQEATVGPNHDDVAYTLGHLADLGMIAGDYAEAESLYRRALAIQESVLGPAHPHLAINLRSLASLREAQGELRDALSILGRALDVEEAHLAGDVIATSPLRRRIRLAKFRGSTDIAVSLSLTRLPASIDAARLALQTILRRKGRLADLERDAVRRIRDRADAEGLAVLARLERQTAHLSVLQEAVASERRDLQRLRARRDAVAAEVESLQRQLAERSAAYREAVRKVTVDDVAAALPRASALLEFVTYRARDPETRQWGRTRYGAYLLHRDGRVRAADLGPTDRIDDQVRRLRRALASRGSVEQAAAALYSSTLVRFSDELGELRQLHVAGDGLLNLVPFDVVQQAAPSTGMEGLTFSYLASGRDLLRPLEELAPSRTAWVVYDVDYDQAERSVQSEQEVPPQARWSRLPGTLEEGRGVKRRLRGAKSLSGASATESALRELKGPRVLHVASHGYFRASTHRAARASPSEARDVAATRSVVLSPAERYAPTADDRSVARSLGDSSLLRSGVVLAGANLPPAGDDNGLLTAAELADIDLGGTQLVVLSACETGTGEIRDGDGVLGLRRAAVLAGARAQVVSLWKVDDRATSALMTSLYRRLSRGSTLGAALERAKEDVRRRSEWRHPYYWAAFTVSGDAEIRPRRRRPNAKP